MGLRSLGRGAGQLLNTSSVNPAHEIPTPDSLLPTLWVLLPIHHTLLENHAYLLPTNAVCHLTTKA